MERYQKIPCPNGRTEFIGKYFKHLLKIGQNYSNLNKVSCKKDN